MKAFNNWRSINTGLSKIYSYNINIWKILMEDPRIIYKLFIIFHFIEESFVLKLIINV